MLFGRIGQFYKWYKVFNSVQASNGVTLVELLVVVSLLSIITLFSTPFYARFFTQNEAQLVQNQLASSLRKAQIYSMMGKQNGVWGVKYTANPQKIILYLLGNTGLDETFDISQEVTITGFSDIQFTRITGLPASPATITISSGATSKTVTVNSQGVVSKTN